MKKTFLVFAALLAMSSVSAFAQCAGLTVNQAGFTPTGEAILSAGTSSSSIALGSNNASTPAATKAIIANISEVIIFVSLGDASITTSSTTGFPIMPGTSVVLATNSSTYIAAASLSGVNTIRISTGY